MVGGDDDGDGHDGRAGDGEHPNQPELARKEGDTDQEIPADMEAGDRRVLVDQGRGLEDPVGIGVLGDRVIQSEVEEAGWGDSI